MIGLSFLSPEVLSDTKPIKPIIDLGNRDLSPKQESKDTSEESSIIGNQFLYDANTIGFNKNGQHYIFKGDVVLVGGASIITADTIEVQDTSKTIIASGHVVFISGSQVFTGTKINFKWDTSEFKIVEGAIAFNDSKNATKLIQRILGLSDEEANFRKAQKEHLANIRSQKEKIRKEVISKAVKPHQISEETIDRYTLLLEQEILVQSNSQPFLARKSLKKREAYQKRRQYWENSRSQASTAPLNGKHFIRIKGQYLEKKGDNEYYIENGMMTPCLCSDDETPAWGFNASHIKLQEEGYINMQHPVLNVKGVPVLYIPYLKLPFKNKRQSGLLMPGIQTGDQKNGTVYTQPIYLSFNDHSDATVTVDMYQKRGTRLGIEGRYEMKEFSGFEFNFESIRDRLWIEQSSLRDQLREYHLNISPYCSSTDSSTSEVLECEEFVNTQLASPSNTWRGRQDWKGKFFLTPRLSFVTKGALLSDHRYVEDLYLPAEYVAAFSTRSQAVAFTTSKARINYDGSDFHLGIGASIGDNVLLPKQFQGYQIPLYLTARTRLYTLNPSLYMGIPIYGSLQAQAFRIGDYARSEDSSITTLGSGSWLRAQAKFISPLVRRGIISIDHFSDFEARRISHQALDEEYSSLASWRAGLTLNLPIDGMGALPSFMQGQSKGSRMLHHLMNWSLTYSARPSVHRRGPYATEDSSGTPLIYMPSDRKTVNSDIRDIPSEEIMVPHQRVTLSTNHRWKVFTRGWHVVPGKLRKQEKLKKEIHSLHEQARRELVQSIDRRYKSEDDMFSEDNKGNVDWYINRYRLQDTDSIEPVSFSANITFDFEQERKRQEQIRENTRLEQQAAGASEEEASTILSQVVNYHALPEAWSGPNFKLGLNWGGYLLTTSLTYNIYKRASTSTLISLSIPPVLGTSVNASYKFEKSPELQDNGDLYFKQTRTTSIGLATSLIPSISTGITLARKRVEGEELQYGTSLNLAYTDPSGCWGLRFIREKDLNQDESSANYILQLSVIFLGSERSADLSPSLEREIPRLTFKR